MRFIGNLYLRQLLTSKIIVGITQDLLKFDTQETIPEEHVIECVLELLKNIGYTLESTPVGKSALVQVCGRMMDLKAMKKKDGKPVLSRRVGFAIQDVLDARNAGWAMKTFKKTAKTKEEIRLEQEAELKAAASGKKVETAEIHVAGARPAYLDEERSDLKNAGVGAHAGDWETAKKSRR